MPYDATYFVVTDVPAHPRDPKSITDPRERVAYLRQAANVLDHYLATGQIDWSAALMTVPTTEPQHS